MALRVSCTRPTISTAWPRSAITVLSDETLHRRIAAAARRTVHERFATKRSCRSTRRITRKCFARN